MMYLWPQAGDIKHLPSGFGVMSRPSDNTIPQGVQEGRVFAIDNEAFTRGFDPERFFRFLEKLAPYRNQVLFVVVPDAVADAAATLDLFEQWAPQIQARGFPVAFVLQDGQEDLELPMRQDFTDWLGDNGDEIDPEDDAAFYAAKGQWEGDCVAFDALFIGGSTEYKLGPETAEFIRWAKRLGLWVHVGRVNSLKRFRQFQLLGADSCDGTFPCYAPTTAARRLSKAVGQPTLFPGGEPC